MGALLVSSRSLMCSYHGESTQSGVMVATFLDFLPEAGGGDGKEQGIRRLKNKGERANWGPISEDAFYAPLGEGGELTILGQASLFIRREGWRTGGGGGRGGFVGGEGCWRGGEGEVYGGLGGGFGVGWTRCGGGGGEGGGEGGKDNAAKPRRAPPQRPRPPIKLRANFDKPHSRPYRFS